MHQTGQRVGGCREAEEPVLSLRDVAVRHGIVDDEGERDLRIGIVLQEGRGAAVLRSLQCRVAVGPGLGHLRDAEGHGKVLCDGVERQLHRLVAEQGHPGADVVGGGIQRCAVDAIQPAGGLAFGEVEFELDALVFEAEEQRVGQHRVGREFGLCLADHRGEHILDRHFFEQLRVQGQGAANGQQQEKGNPSHFMSSK